MGIAKTRPFRSKSIRMGIEGDYQLPSRGLYSQAKPSGNYLAMMADAGQRFGLQYLQLPEVVSEEVWVLLEEQIFNTISDYNSSQFHRLLDDYPGLNLTVGEDLFDMHVVAAALVDYLREYERDAMEVCAHMVQTCVWNQVTGSTSPMVMRAKPGLRPNQQRSAWAPCKGMLIRKQTKQYIFDHSVICTTKNGRGIESVVLFVWLPTKRNYVDYYSQRVDFTPQTGPDASPFGDLTLHAFEAAQEGSAIPTPIHMIQNAVNYSATNQVDPSTADGKIFYGLESKYSTGPNVQSMGQIIGSMLVRRHELVYEFVAKYRDTMLARDSDIRKFFTGAIPSAKLEWFDDTMQINDALDATFPVGMCDLEEFMTKHGIYCETPQPILSEQAWSAMAPAGKPSGWYADDGTPNFTNRTSSWQYRRSPYAAERLSVIQSVRSELEALTDNVGAEEILARLGGFMSMWTNDPDELQRLRNTASTGSNLLVEVHGKRYVDFTPDFSKWFITGGNPNAGNIMVAGKWLSPTSNLEERGVGSFTLERGLNIDPLVAGGFNARQYHVGFAPRVMDLVSMVSASISRFVSREGTTAQQMLALGGDRGNWYVMEDEFISGVIMPKCIIKPLKNRYDVLQCGVHQIMSAEDVDVSSPFTQPDPLAYCLSLDQSDGISALTTSLVWQNQSKRNLLLDTPAYVGRAFGLTPSGMMMDRDAVAFAYTETVATSAGGIPYPTCPYLSRVATKPRASKYVMDVVGYNYDEVRRTMRFAQIGIPLGAVTGNFDYLSNHVTGEEAPSYKPLTAWMNWLPHMVWDPTYPVEEGIHAYLEAAMSRAEQLLSGKIAKSVIEAEESQKVPLGSTPLTPGILAILDVPSASPKAGDNSKEPNINVKSAKAPFVKKGGGYNNGHSGKSGRGNGRRGQSRGRSSFGSGSSEITNGGLGDKDSRRSQSAGQKPLERSGIFQTEAVPIQQTRGFDVKGAKTGSVPPVKGGNVSAGKPDGKMPDEVGGTSS